MRTSSVHYIVPSAISITPNNNSSANDVSVYIVRGARINVHSPGAGIDYVDAQVQTWSLRGRNRRLADIEKPYTIYARLSKTDHQNGYLVFAPKNPNENEWSDKYNYITKDGLSSISNAITSADYWYVRMGDVSLPDNGKRTITIDTGILGTDLYNSNWELSADSLPLQVGIQCTIEGTDAGSIPYVRWDKTVNLAAVLCKGWNSNIISRTHTWSLSRNTGHPNADAAWPDETRAAAFSQSGQIALLHTRGDDDDFCGSMSATFTITAWGTDLELGLVKLATGSVTIMAETVEKYELVLSSLVVNYNPISGAYSPSDGVLVTIRATDQQGNVYKLSRDQISYMGLSAYYSPSDIDATVSLSFADGGNAVGVGVIPVSAFSLQKSMNVRLLNADYHELSSANIAFVKDGEDTREREWIFLRSEIAIDFGGPDSDHPAPHVIEYGEVNPEGAAEAIDDDDNQEGWVPEGWYDEMSGADETYRYEYSSYRDFVHNEELGDHWGTFTRPSIWDRWDAGGASYRCRWTLDGKDVWQLERDENGIICGSLPLVATLLVRKGSEEREAPTSPTIVKLIFDGLSDVFTFNTDVPQFVISETDHNELIPLLNEQGLTGLSMAFVMADDILTYRLPVVFATEALEQTIEKAGSKIFLSRVNQDVAEEEIAFRKGVKIGNFRSRLLGSGAAVDAAGNAEFESIYSRSFISTPEFRFNRVFVTDGEQWCTNGYGTIESVVEGEDENGNTVVNGGLIILHLEENDYASVAVGDICRGIYNDITSQYQTADLDDDAESAAGTSAQEGDGIGFSSKRGFFTSYFYIERIVKSLKGECQFIYKLRSATTPLPCAFMKFAQYGSFTNADRRASSYATSIGHYYEMVLEGVKTWQIESANVVYRKGYLGDMEVELADHTTRQLQGYGLYAQNNVYFGSAVVQLDPYTLEMMERDLAQYDVNLGEHVDMIVVDDTGNVIGGVYTETTEGGTTTREYRIHSAITVRKKNVLLTEALAGAEAGAGTYKISFTPVGCTAMIENSTLYITGIDHVKDGVAGSGDDTDFDYDAMRAVDSCRVDLVIDCEGVTSVQKSISIVVKHDSQPYVGADISNQFSGVSWNTKTQQYAGLPIVFDFKMWHNDEVLDIVSDNDVSVTLADGTAIPNTWTYTKTIVENASGNKVARISISGLPANLGLVTDLNITCAATYSGVRYERTLVHTINKSTDTNVYSLIPSVDEVIVNKNTGGLSSNSVDISVVCDSSDNKHYAVAYNQFGIHQLCICYKKFYTDGTSDANETEYTGTAVSVDSSVERVSFFLYKKAGNTIDRTVLHDKEDVPVIANGQDGKGVEYIFITQNTETPVPTINDVAADRQVDNYCPYTDAQHTAQWTDEPTGVASNAKFEFYAQRKKVNGVWQPFGEVKLWNRYVVDGVTPYVIDLSNEQSMVACDESGGVVGSYETSKLMLFYGQSYAFNDFAITIKPTNITCNNSAVEFTLTAEQKAAAQAAGYFTLTPSDIKQDSATIAITATKGNIVLSAVYKVNKAYAGKNGVIYSLIPSLDTIRKDQSGSIVSTDTTLTLQVKKTVGASTTILTTYAQLTDEGLSLNYVNASGSTVLTDVSIATSTLIGSGAWGKIELIKNSVIVDSERINVVFDGNDGDGGYGIVLTLTRDNYTEENWATYAVVGANENFGYSDGVIVRAGDYFIVEGISTDSGLMHTATFKCTNQTSTKVYGDCISHICDGKKGDQGDDGIYYEEEYAIGSSRSSHDSLSWSSGSVTPTDANPYVWKRSRSVNPNTTPYTYGSWVYVCLTGATGQVGNTGPMYYPAGIHDPNKAYSVTAQLVPVVCSGSGNTASYYYAKQSISAGQNIPVTNTNYWQAFSTFAATFINVLFASFAKLGSFVIKDNWFISQYGTVNGSNSANYEAFNGNFTNQTTNFIPYLAFDAENGTIFGQKGTIGGFTIGATSLGTSQITGQEDGYTFIRRDGKIKVWCSSTSDYALQVNGSVNLITNAQGQLINISCPSGGININASNLNLNTSANNQNVVNIGSTQSASVNINANVANFGSSTPVNIGSTLAVSGLASLAGNIKTSSFTLPGSTSNPPKVGTIFLCKGISSDMTVTAPTGFSIMASDSRLTVTSLSLQDNAAILVYMKDNTWVHFRCD